MRSRFTAPWKMGIDPALRVSSLAPRNFRALLWLPPRSARSGLMLTSPETNSGCVCAAPRPSACTEIRLLKIVPLIGYSDSLHADCYAARPAYCSSIHRIDPLQYQFAADTLLRIGAGATDGDAPPRGRFGRGTDVTNWNRSRCPASRRQLGETAPIETWLCPGYPRREGLYFPLTRSERLGPEVRLVGAPIVA
jgi:hypothetical protein